MASYKSSSNLRSLEPNTKAISFATASKSNPTESLPTEQRWWAAKFHLGPKDLIPSKKTTSSTSVTFQTPSAGSAIISHVAFAPNTIKGYPYQIAIASGPRVGLYGGTPTSSLSRSLARPTRKAGKAGGGEMTLFGEDELDVKPDRTISSGGQPAHHVSYHHDGRLLALGCDHGYLKICDAQSRATIRTFTTHGVKGGFPIRTTGWLPEGKNKQRMIWSAGDDATLRIWDLSGDIVGVGDNVKPLATMKGHGDAIRSAVLFSHDEKSCLVTGSYDHTLRVWNLNGLASQSISNQDDEENDKCVSVMDHGAPVEVLLVIHPKNEAPVIVSAGGTIIKLWNPILGECLSTIQTKHSKTITSLCLTTIIKGTGERDGAEGQIKTISKRILSGGLDGLIRIYSADSIFHDTTEKKGGKNDSSEKYHLQYLHGVKTSLPITSMAMSPDNTRLVIGSNNGMVTVRQRAKFVAQGVKRKNTEQPRAGTYSYFMRGATVGADADDHVVIIERKKKLQKFDQHLQKFRHGDALDAALATKDPQAVSII